MNKVKILFIGSQETGFEALSVLLNDNRIEIVGVFALKPAPHEKWEKSTFSLAKEHDVPVWEFEDHLTKDRIPENLNDEKYIKIVQELSPDLIFVLGWRQLIGKSIREIPELGVIGIHFSLLPKFRGHAPVSWSIIEGEEYGGLSLFFFESGADTGDVIVQKKTKIGLEDTSKSLRSRLIKLTRETILEIIPQIVRREIKSKPQDVSHASIAAYRLPWHGEIDWSKSSKKIYDEIRATTHPYPGAFTYFKGNKIIIWEAKMLPITPKYVGNPGQVLLKNKSGLIVKTGDHAILLKTIQVEDSKEVPAFECTITTKHRFGLDIYTELSALKNELKELKSLLKLHLEK